MKKATNINAMPTVSSHMPRDSFLFITPAIASSNPTTKTRSTYNIFMTLWINDPISTRPTGVTHHVRMWPIQLSPGHLQLVIKGVTKPALNVRP